MNEDQRLVTIAQFESSFEAELAKITLENEGIHTVIVGSTLGASFPYSGEMDFVELQVFEKDRAAAERILSEMDSDLEDTEDDSEDDEEEDRYDQEDEAKDDL